MKELLTYFLLALFIFGCGVAFGINLNLMRPECPSQIEATDND